MCCHGADGRESEQDRRVSQMKVQPQKMLDLPGKQERWYEKKE